MNIENNTKSIDRLSYYIDNKGYNFNQLATNIGVSNSYFSKMVKNKGSLGEDIINKILLFYEDLNPEWFITGRGEMLKRDSQQQNSIPKFELSISQFRQKGYAPYYSDLPLSAGQMGLTNIEQRENPESWIKFPDVNVDGWFPVIGCSMEPKIFAGDIVGVKQIDNWERIDPDKTYMIITHDDRMIKHLETDDNDNSILWAVSENYNRFKIYKDEIIRIFRVVWAGRFV